MGVVGSGVELHYRKESELLVQNDLIGHDVHSNEGGLISLFPVAHFVCFFVFLPHRRWFRCSIVLLLLSRGVAQAGSERQRCKLITSSITAAGFTSNGRTGSDTSFTELFKEGLLHAGH